MNKVDLEWDDSEVLPDIIRPDVDFLFQRMTQATLEELIPDLGERILDVGCGRALDAINIVKTGATVIAMEPSRVMIAHALELINQNGYDVSLLRGIGEFIPIMPGIVDKVVCKGALDHFTNPENAIKQMVAVLKPGGTIVISIANFESLGFKIGKFIYGIRRLLRIKNPYQRLPWEPPPDHTIKMDYRLILSLMHRNTIIKRVIGVSLFCGSPGWGNMLAKLPESLSRVILNGFDRLAYLLPAISDVVIVTCEPKK